MNWLEMNEDEILTIVNPIMDNLMQASTDLDYEKHVKDFSKKLKGAVTKEILETQCNEYQAKLGTFTDREFIGVVRRQSDVRVFWETMVFKIKK